MENEIDYMDPMINDGRFEEEDDTDLDVSLRDEQESEMYEWGYEDYEPNPYDGTYSED